MRQIRAKASIGHFDAGAFRFRSQAMPKGNQWSLSAKLSIELITPNRSALSRFSTFVGCFVMLGIVLESDVNNFPINFIRQLEITSTEFLEVAIVSVLF